MAENYYDDTVTDREPKPSTEQPMSEEGGEKEEVESEGLLPISFFPETPKPGKRCMIQVERVYDDQVGVSYVEHASEEPRGKPEPEEEMDERYA